MHKLSQTIPENSCPSSLCTTVYAQVRSSNQAVGDWKSRGLASPLAHGTVKNKDGAGIFDVQARPMW